MANIAPVYSCIDKGFKENAEGIPFQSKLPDIKHFSAQGITKSEFDAELQKGIDSIKNGRTHSVEDFDRMLAEEFGI